MIKAPLVILHHSSRTNIRRFRLTPATGDCFNMTAKKNGTKSDKNGAPPANDGYVSPKPSKRHRVDPKRLCRCGNLCRPGQNNCWECNRDAVKRHRERTKRRVRQAEQIAQLLHGNNLETRKQFESKFPDRHVIYLSNPGEEVGDISGMVTDFFPDGVVGVTDYYGQRYKVPMHRLKHDRDYVIIDDPYKEIERLKKIGESGLDNEQR